MEMISRWLSCFVFLACLQFAHAAWSLPYEIVEDVLPFDLSYSSFEQVEASDDYLVVVQGPIAYIWDRADKRLRLTLNLSSERSESVPCRVVLLANKLIAACEDDTELRAWALPTGVQTQAYATHFTLSFKDDWLSPVLKPWHHAGKRMVLADWVAPPMVSVATSSMIQLLDLDSLKPIRSFEVAGLVTAYTMSLDYLVLGVEIRGRLWLKVFDARDGCFRFEIPAGGEAFESLAVKDDKLWAVIAENDATPYLHRWSLADRKYLGRFKQRSGHAVEIYPAAQALRLNRFNPYYFDTEWQRWNAQTQGFEPWKPTADEAARLLDQPGQTNIAAGVLQLVGSNGVTEAVPLRYEYRFWSGNFWWPEAGNLYLHHAETSNYLDRLRPERQDFGTMYHLRQQEWFIHSLGHYAYFRQEETLTRLDLSSGKGEPWLTDSKPCRAFPLGHEPQSFIADKAYFQFCRSESGQAGDTLVRVWDMTHGTKLGEFAAPAPPKSKGKYFIGPWGDTIGLVYYDEADMDFVHVWNYRTGQKLLERKQQGIYRESCSNSLPENNKLESSVWQNKEDGQIEILICNSLSGQVKKRHLFPSDSEMVQVLVDDEHLYLLNREGQVQVRDIHSGRLIKKWDEFADILREQGYYQLKSAMLSDGLLRLEPDFGEITLPSRMTWFGLMNPETGQVLKQFWFDQVWARDPKGVYLKNRTSLFRLEAGMPESRQKQVELQVFAYPDALLVVSPEGYFLGYGKYRQYFHLARDGYMIPWEEAEAQWWNPAEVQKAVDRVNRLKATAD